MATPNIQLTLPPFNSTEWNQPVNANFTIIDSVFGSTANIAITGTQTDLKLADTQNLRINLSGNLEGYVRSAARCCDLRDADLT